MNLTVVSSFRPFGENPQWDRNQIMAGWSWRSVFDRIVYLNYPEPLLRSHKTTFNSYHTQPDIKWMCLGCASYEGWSFIVNADIVIAPWFREAVRRAISIGAWAVVSQRWQVASPNGVLAVTDNGLDVFGAKTELWAKAHIRCPPQLRLGHPTWDTWMVGFFNENAKGHFYDLTPSRAVYHPKHDDRRMPFNVDGALRGLTLHCGVPRAKVTV